MSELQEQAKASVESSLPGENGGEASLRTIRGRDGWTLYCVIDGAPEEGMAVVSGGHEGDLLTGTWFAADGHVTRVKLWASATLTDQFCSMLSEALALDVFR